jgi:F-type H+-transporting ATPase subunit alpha
MKQVGSSLKLELAQYRELAAFAQFGSDLDKATQAQLNRGARLVELLKQGQFEPLPFTHQVLAIYAGTNGFLDDLAVSDVRPFEKALYSYVDTANPALFKNIAEKKALTDDIKADIAKTIKEAKERFIAERGAERKTAVAAQ